MPAGEFAFELLEGNNVVATCTNSADGNVALGPITYIKPVPTATRCARWAGKNAGEVVARAIQG